MKRGPPPPVPKKRSAPPAPKPPTTLPPLQPQKIQSSEIQNKKEQPLKTQQTKNTVQEVKNSQVNQREIGLEQNTQNIQQDNNLNTEMMDNDFQVKSSEQKDCTQQTSNNIKRVPPPPPGPPKKGINRPGLPKKNQPIKVKQPQKLNHEIEKKEIIPKKTQKKPEENFQKTNKMSKLEEQLKKLQNANEDLNKSDSDYSEQEQVDSYQQSEHYKSEVYELGVNSLEQKSEILKIETYEPQEPQITIQDVQKMNLQEQQDKDQQKEVEEPIFEAKIEIKDKQDVILPQLLSDRNDQAENHEQYQRNVLLIKQKTQKNAIFQIMEDFNKNKKLYEQNVQQLDYLVSKQRKVQQSEVKKIQNLFKELNEKNKIIQEYCLRKCITIEESKKYQQDGSLI